MTYATDDGKIVERIWNSRDGVTPFIVMTRDGSKQMTHVEWNRDEYRPDHVPQNGDRIFADMTREVARAYAVKRVERDWEHAGYPLSKMFPSKDAAIEHFVTEWARPGAPDIITVGEREG